VLLFQFILPAVNLDANQDGKLTVDDVEPGLKHIWAQTGGRVEALPHEITKKAFEEADKDKDGTISQKEFENWVGRAPAALHTSAVAIGSI
jgi:Ca2+-binding EF-hand superfamily protein